MNTKPLKLYIEGERILIAKLPMKHALLINEENEDEYIVHNSEDNPLYKCVVAQASVLEGKKVSYLTLETKLVECDTAVYEPVPGNVGTQFLCPGIVKLESDKDKKKSRFVIRYMNFTNENVQLEPGKTLGYVQSCKREALPSGHDNNVFNNITEKSEEEKLGSLTEIVNDMYPHETKENKILRELITKYPSVFASENDPPSVSPFFYHTVKLQSMPKPRKPYSIPACFQERVSEQIEAMERQGIIRPSRSNFHSPLVPVIKKDGKVRTCVDFRNLNQHVVNDSYPLPNNNILHHLGKGKVFSCLDLKQGYHQIQLSEESKPWTAFVAPNGLYEHNVLPMGLKDFPAAFCRIINQVLVGLTV